MCKMQQCVNEKAQPSGPWFVLTCGSTMILEKQVVNDHDSLSGTPTVVCLVLQLDHSFLDALFDHRVHAEEL